MDMSEPVSPCLHDLQADLARAQLRISHLARSEQLCRSGLIELNASGQVVALSAGMLALLGADAGAAVPGVGLTLDELPWLSPRERVLVARFWRGAALDEPFEFEHSVMCTDGQSLRVLHRGLLQASPVAGEAPCGIVTLQDITERRDAERRLMQLANFDEVTGLANRANLLHRIDAAVHSSAWRGVGFCLMSIDVPRVAELALTMGFAAGDALATTLAARLLDQCDGDAVVATLGGGEFALMLPHQGSVEAAQQQAMAIKAALQQPVNMSGMDICAISAVVNSTTKALRLPEPARTRLR
jgi:diguanylate cyclase (GGDEF)-like protein